jgi:hypothetical protein
MNPSQKCVISQLSHLDEDLSDGDVGDPGKDTLH